jgi:hypothetical protein
MGSKASLRASPSLATAPPKCVRAGRANASQISFRSRPLISYAAVFCPVAKPFGHDITRVRWAVVSKGEELTAESMVASSIRP